MVAYHWTTKENAGRILKVGLSSGSWVCKDYGKWNGEVCLKLDVDIDWSDPNKCDWQRRVWNGVPLNKISMVQ